MSKLSKDDIDAFLGKDSFYSNQDKQRFFEKLHEPQKRTWFPQLATVLMILVVLFVGYQFSKDFTGFESNRDQPLWETASNMKFIENYYAKKTPGLVRAEELGLVTEVDQTIVLENGADLHIDNIWYNSTDVFLFYSIGKEDIGALMKGEDFGPAITRMSVTEDEEGKYPSQTLAPYTLNMTREDGVIYQDRFYHRISFLPIRDKDNVALAELKDALDVNITLDMFGEGVTVNEVSLPIDYDKSEEHVYTKSLNQTIEQDGITLTFDSIQIGVTQNLLFGHVDIANGDRLRSIDATITTGQGDSHRVFGSVQDWEQPNQFKFEIPAFNYEPEEITITVDSVDMISDESFAFAIDVSDYEEKLTKLSESYEASPHEYIGETMHTSIYLDRLYYDDRGINFDILYEPTIPNQKKQLLEDTPRTPEDPAIANQPLLISAYNEKGEAASFGQRGNGPGHRFGIFLAKEFVEVSNKVDITIENLLYKVQVDESVTGSISDK